MAGFLLNLGELAYRKEERITVTVLADGAGDLAQGRAGLKPGSTPGVIGAHCEMICRSIRMVRMVCPPGSSSAPWPAVFQRGPASLEVVR